MNTSRKMDMAIRLPTARALTMGVVAALVLAGTGMMGMIYGTFSMDRLYTAKEYTKAGIDND